MSITILNPGMLTSVQDLGRIGYQQYGVSVSGVMDPRSASIANILVDNDEGEAVLECTMMGPHLRFDAPNIIAITGGDLGATLDGQSIDTYRAVPVNAGQTLRFTMLRTGCRAFVAFAGGLDIPLVMGSRSTDMKAKIGGYQGRKLQKDDVIAFRAPKTDLKNLGVRHISPEFVPRAEYKLRVVFGPQDDAFTELGAMTFLSSVYTLTPEFDRMGCRLDGELIEHIKDGNIISDGIAFGAIQVPSAGKPIIMLADRQTTGGYTKIANVISADFRILAQLKAGDRVRFEKVSITTAQEALLAQRAALRCLRGAMNRGTPETHDMGEGGNICTDIPKYRIYRDGKWDGKELTDVSDYWKEGYVGFLIGCSFSFEETLMREGIEIRHIAQGRNVPMFKTNIMTEPAGPFCGPMVCSMRPMTPENAKKAYDITVKMPNVHGAPVHMGDAAEVGVADVMKPDYGEAVDFYEGEIPVFWPCGVTPQAAVENAKPPIAITHAPGHMFITDIINSELNDFLEAKKNR